MPRYFECLNCGAVTPVEDSPPICPKCGHGTGVLHETDPAAEDGKKDREKPGSKPGDPPAKARAAVQADGEPARSAEAVLTALWPRLIG